jgi:hypothetical protein
MQHTIEIDPEEILGVRPGASLEEIRAAYHQQAKKYHPDAKGDAWAFRMVTRAYEILGRSRVASRLVEERARASPAHPTPPRPAAAPLRTQGAEEEQVRAGVRDAVADPALLVDAEILIIHYETTDPAEFFLTAPEDRNLSCTLNLAWPSRRGSPSYAGPTDPRPYVKRLEAALKPLAKSTGATASRALDEAGRYSLWLTYPTASKAAEAFRAAHQALRAAGFGVDQRTRNLMLPREAE